MAEQVFVGRAPELARLEATLAAALAGASRVVMVTGEAGSGKTTMIREFARSAEAAHPDLVVAIGYCNAQTGQGDPYLPFLEILQLLSGAGENTVARNTVDAENGRRLQHLVAQSADVILDLGPDLVGLMLAAIPLAGIAAKVGSIFARKAGFLDRLEKRNAKQIEAAAVDPAVDQGRIFEQYTTVLRTLAVRRPLLVILDDLQWADAGSVNLLFHLVRRLGDSRILILGTYRPDEVAMGRGDDPHPLDKVLAELKRYYGEIVVDLGRARETEGRQFVDALLDTESNALDDGFRQALFAHTEGHPLFIVELLRTMQESEALTRDAAGRLVAGPDLDWSALPARVEGVIEERIGRLAEAQRDLLAVASVEGTDFTVQVVARVQELQERSLLRELSRDLEARHHLVREAGEVRAGRQFLFRYQFTHALFQQYLYHGLSSGERRLLHGEIARVLEELYAGRSADITVQLAHHYAEAGDVDKAVEYLLQAGERARALYANGEAIDLFARAVVLVEEAGAGYDVAAHGALVDRLYEGLGDVRELTGQHEPARAAYGRAHELVGGLDPLYAARLARKVGKTWEMGRGYGEALAAYDRAEAALGSPRAESEHAWWQEWVQIQLLRLWVLHWRGQWQAMTAYIERIRPPVEAHGTPTQRSKFFTALVLMALGRDRYVVADETLAHAQAALAAIHEDGTPSEIALTGIVLGLAHLWRRELDAADAAIRAALAEAERAGDLIVRSRALAYLPVVSRLRSDTAATRAAAERGLALAREAAAPEDEGLAHANLAWAAFRAGDPAGALDHGEAALGLWRQLPLTTHTQWLALWPLAGAALARGDLATAVAHARALLDPAQQRLPDAQSAPLAAALAAWDAGDVDGAGAALAAAAAAAQADGYL